MNYNTKFKQDLENKFNNKNISSSSIRMYIRNLEKLNDDQPLKNIKFLDDVDYITKQLEGYKKNTIKNYIISICSTLNVTDNKNKTYDKYYKILCDLNKEIKQNDKEGVKNETQAKNWMTWEEVKQIHDNLKDDVAKFKNLKELNIHKYNKLLSYLILSLYVALPPKRNQDWTLMKISNSNNNDANYNYLNLKNNEFIFNKYKTYKKNGELIEKIPEDLLQVIKVYLKYHPLYKNNKKSNPYFLVYYDGSPLSSVNSITRILNNIFNKKIGSSMLRHIFLSSKFGNTVEEMKQTAEKMGHNINTAIDVYIKK